MNPSKFHWIILPLLAILVWTSPAAADSTAGTNDKFSLGVFWKISKGDLPPSYILGTIHSDRQPVLALPKAARDAFTDCDTFIMEVSLEKENVEKSGAAIFFSDGRSLEPILGPDLYARVRTALLSYGLPPQTVVKIKPWAAAGALATPDPQTGEFLGQLLFYAAESQKKKIIGLETPEEQLELYDGMPMEDQIKLLRETLKNLSKFPRMHDELVDAYVAGNLRAVAHLVERFMSADNAQLADRLLRDLIGQRSQRLGRRILSHLKDGNVFIAVGAIHLVGKNGILGQIEAAGYQLRAIY